MVDKTLLRLIVVSLQLFLGLFVAMLAGPAGAQSVHFDFENGQLQGWRVMQGHFGQVITERAKFHNLPQEYNKQGRFFLSTLECPDGTPDDIFTGVIESPVFVLAAPQMTMWVGGGRRVDTYVALCLLDGTEVCKAQGIDQEPLQRVEWQMPALVGQPVYLRLVDQSKISWGHLTFDDFQAQGHIDEAATAQRFDHAELQERLRQLQARLNPELIRTTRLAVESLIARYGDQYPGGPDYRSRLNQCDQDLHALAGRVDDAGMQKRAALADRFEALRREALVANPLVSAQPLVFVVRAQYLPDHHNTETMFQTGECNTASFHGGSALKIIDLAHGGKARTLVDVPQGIARDPEVHFDGQKIIFSMRRNKDEDYKIHEINADGSGLRQLTFTAGVTDIDPLYLPDDSIVFSSTRDPKYCMCNIHIMANLFRMGADGSNINQIGRDTLFEGHGALLPDGRILYDRWEYVDRNFGDAQGLWTVNPDGTNHALYWGNNTPSPGGVIDARPIPGADGQVIAILGSCHDRPWGALGIIDPSRGLDGRAPIVRSWPAEAADLAKDEGQNLFDSYGVVRLKYEDPFPLSDQFFLCSRMTGEGERMGIYLIDVFGNELLLHAEGAGCYDPMPLKARPRPPVIPARRNYKNGEGTFYVEDVYQGTQMKGVARGSVKWLRVVEEPPKRFWTVPAWGGQGVERPAMNWHDFNSKRILGTVPVEADGSVSFKAPEGRFIYFQLLDRDGMMVQSMRSGTTVQSGESAGCMGCHENRLSAPPDATGRVLTALRQPPRTLDGWRGLTRPFNYRADVQPVFDKYCVGCHDFGKPADARLVLAGDRDLVFSASYNELWRKGLTGAIGAGPAQVQPAYSWGSHASRLIKTLRDGHQGVRLDAESFDRLVTWIDLNAPYYPDYASAYPANLAGRAPLDDVQLTRLTALTGVKFAEQAGFGTNKGPQVSFARPELSPCLAGLRERAPDNYNEALAIIRAGAAMLARQPDAEMDGFVPCPTDQARQQKLETLQRQEQRNREALDQGTQNYEGPARDVAGGV